MKTVITPRITKIIFVVSFILTTMFGYGQCTVITPGSISGPANVCPFLNTGDELTYSIDALPFATSYEWVVPPSATLITGQGTTSINITIGSNFSTFANKVIKVRALFPCGTSEYRLFYLKSQAPETPKPITGGSADICSFIGTFNAVAYTIRAVPGATSYSWTNPASTLIAHLFTGANDTTVLLIFQAGYTGGNLTVECSNNCGTSGIRTLGIQLNPPSKPGLISGIRTICNNTIPSGTPITYSVSPVPGATSYEWTAPTGSQVTHPNGAGPNDFTITVLFPDGFVNGNITVSCSNDCATSGVRSLAVKKLLPSAPGGITTVELSICPSRINTYSVEALPLNSTSIEWIAPVGGTIINGQGSTSVTVSYTADAINGNISATGVSDCGTSQPRTIPVHLLACGPRPSAPLAARNSKSTEQGSDIMILNVSPNPSAGDFNVKVSGNDNADISVRVLDMSGRLLKRMAVKRNETILFGNDLKPGSYILEVTQGSTRRIQKLVKF